MSQQQHDEIDLVYVIGKIKETINLQTWKYKIQSEFWADELFFLLVLQDCDQVVSRPDPSLRF